MALPKGGQLPITVRVSANGDLIDNRTHGGDRCRGARVDAELFLPAWMSHLTGGVVSVPGRATLRQDCYKSCLTADELLTRPTHGDRAGAGGASGHAPLNRTDRADQNSGHA